MSTLWQDLRYGARILLKHSGLTAIAITAPAISIGASTAIFSAIDALLMRPLPIEQIDGLVVPITWRQGFDPGGMLLARPGRHAFASGGNASL